MCDTVNGISVRLADIPARLSQSTSTGKQDFGQKCMHLHRFNRGFLPKGHFDLLFCSAI